MNIAYENDIITGFIAIYNTGNVAISFTYRLEDDNYTCNARDITSEHALSEKLGCADTYNYLMIHANSLYQEIGAIFNNFETTIVDPNTGDATKVEDVIVTL